MRRGREWEKKPGEGKGGTLPPSCLVLEQPEQQQLWWECHRLAVIWNWDNLTSMWKLLLAGNCGSSTEPLEYIVSIWARYPIGGVNKEGIPLSQLPQQRRKGEEQSWWEEKWSEGRGGEGCTVRGEEDIVCLWLWATEKHELSGHVWVCLESVFVCGHVWMSGLDWVCVGGSMHVYVCLRSLQFGMLGGRSKDAQTKLDFFFTPFLSFLNGDWGLARFLYSCCLAQLRFRVSVVHVRFKPPKLPVTQDWLRGSLILDFAGQWLREPCDSEWVVTGGFSSLILTKWKIRVQQAMTHPSRDHISVNGSFCCEYILFSSTVCSSQLGFHEILISMLTYLRRQQ